MEIANDGPGQIYVADPAQPASPGMMRQADAPVYGPAAPTEADCAWATASTTAAMSAPERWSGTRQAYAEAEAATYAAAYHLGLDEAVPSAPGTGSRGRSCERPDRHPGGQTLEELIERYATGQPARSAMEQADYDHLARLRHEPEAEA